MDRRLIPHIQQRIEAEIARASRENALEPKPKERIAISDQRALLSVAPRRILTGEVEVVDDRERPPR
jgi:sensor domain CHASE-containing protein